MGSISNHPVDPNNLTTSCQPQYLYNTASQVTTLIYPSGKRVRLNHDTRGRMNGLDKVDSSGNLLANYVTSIGYNTAGQVTNFNLVNGVNETYNYSNDRLQLTSQTAVKGAGTLLSLTYGYAASAGQSGATSTAGNSGQVMSVTGTVNSQSRNQSFTYDNVGRLLTAGGWDASTNRRFSYDRWGNRAGMWNATSGGTQLQSITIATTSSVANNRIASVGSTTYQYDASGNVTNDGAHTYTYDGAGRLANVDSGATASFSYDANNWRVKKTTGGVTTHCVWEGAQVIAEYIASTGALISEYLYAGSRMVGREQSGVLRYYHADRLSTRLITDAAGAVVGTEDHLPFGEDAGVVGESEKHRFTNYERDGESGTDYTINRQHQFINGRFMQPDVIAGSTADPQSLNRYTYSLNDPMNVKDSLGLDPVVLIDGVDPYGVGGFRYGPNGVYGGYHGDLNILFLYKRVLRGYEFPVDVLTRVAFVNNGQNLPTSGLKPGDLIKLAPPSAIPQLPKPPTPIHCRPDVIAAMNRAWARTGNGTSGNEAGFVLNGNPSKYQTVDTKSGNTQNEQKRDIFPDTFLLFHVHPNRDTRNPSTPESNAKGSRDAGDTLISDTYFKRGCN